jgi:predicted nucleotidyltransferase
MRGHVGAGGRKVTEMRTIPAHADRQTAIGSARSATQALAACGVTAMVIGSLAKGHFGPGSDIDFLITACPRHLKYAIEGIVEDALAGIPFDVVYLEEIPGWKVARFTEAAIDASDLR